MIWLLAAALSLSVGDALSADDPERFTYHRVTNPRSPSPQARAEETEIPSLVSRLKYSSDWSDHARPRLLRQWTQILGKLQPTAADRHWFGDLRQARILKTEDRGSYERIELEIPLERDFFQPHVLLKPKGKGRFPAVIAWTSTTPDYRVPEQWWGQWLAEHGYVVLCGWSHIRNYRDGSSYRDGVSERVYERFGHWLGMGKMVYDVRREAEYLRTLGIVDRERIGFIGFSLSAKTALYVAAFAPEIAAVVSVDPHIAINGGTNWFAPWYLDWTRPFPDIPTPQHTVLSLLDTDPQRPGLEHDHHEILALAAPKPLLILGGSDTEDAGGDSDDHQSWGYVNRALEVYKLYGAGHRLQYVLTGEGHKPNGPLTDEAWRTFFERWLKK